MTQATARTAETPVTRPERPAILRLRGVVKRFEAFTAVDGIDLDVHEGEFLTIVGPSGSGKTTLLRMLAGMEQPTGGEISLRGQVINDVPANRRPTCLVFQSLALFPHRTVGQNIEFSLKMKSVDAKSRRARALELMRLMRLPEDYYGKNVMRCSGGEKQRVALARAFAYDPEILFFDEPLSALDYKLRKTLEKELKDVHRETGKTFIYITHSLEEAMVMSDRIGVMRGGKLVQVGAPEDIYMRPSNRFVAEFMGETNVFAVNRIEGERYEAAELGVGFRLPPGTKGSSGHVVVRPEFLRLVERADEADNVLEAVLYNSYSLGSRNQFRVRVGDKTLIVEETRGRTREDRLDRPVLVGFDARDAIFVGD